MPDRPRPCRRRRSAPRVHTVRCACLVKAPRSGRNYIRRDRSRSLGTHSVTLWDANGDNDLRVLRGFRFVIGNLNRLKRTCADIGRKRDREMRLTQWLDEVRNDARFAWRQLKTSPGFTLVATLTLALGIGANSAMFALADAALLRPLPYPGSDRLVLIEERAANARGTLRSRIALANFHDWTAGNRTFEVMAAFYAPPGGGGPAVTVADGSSEIIPNQNVTARFFEVLGVTPILGRTFQPSDEAGGDVVVMSEGFWRTRFGGDPTIVGRGLSFDGRVHTVIGIVPADFQFLRPASMWTLLRRPDGAGERRLSTLRVIGRLERGVTPAAARTDLTTIADSLAEQFGDTRTGRIVTVEPFRNELVGRELRLTSMLFLGVVGFVLLMCCANVANLLLARATVRSRELSVRAALGAGRVRIIRQLLTESVALGALGGLAGAGVAGLIIAAAPSLIPPGLLPPGIALRFDGRIVVFCAATALGVSVLFGLAPAWQATAGSLAAQMTGGGRSVTGRGGRFRRVLLAGQTAAAVLLLCGAGLLLRSLLAVEDFDPGYRAPADALLTMDVTVYRNASANGSRFRDEDTWLSFFDGVQQEVARVPGVRGVAWATTLPVGDSQTGAQRVRIAGDPPSPRTMRRRRTIRLSAPGNSPPSTSPSSPGAPSPARTRPPATRSASSAKHSSAGTWRGEALSVRGSWSGVSRGTRKSSVKSSAWRAP